MSQTAVGVAAIRALESARVDRLFDDRLAAKFVAASGRPLAERRQAAAADGRAPQYWNAIQIWVVIRTRFLDDFLADACAEGCRQVVLLGAGLDARAFRLDLPAGVRFFELDLPGVLEFKQRVVDATGARPNGARSVVPCDLSEDWPTALAAAGYRPEVRSAWIAEGLLVYLRCESLRRVGAGTRGGVGAAAPVRGGAPMVGDRRFVRRRRVRV